MTIKDRVERRGDMHPTRTLKILVQSDGDVIVAITQDGSLIEDEQHRVAQIEFCGSGGKSLRTHAALLELMAAMKEDNEQRLLP